MVKKVLITGVSGFVGQSLCRWFLENTNYDLIGISRSVPRDVWDNTRFRFIQSDLTRDLSIDEIGIDIIIHLASQQPNRNDLSYEDFYQGNVLTTRTMINIAKKNQVKQFIYLSTTTVYSSSEKLNEGSFIQPSNHYGLTKYVAERLLEIDLKKVDIQVSVLRCPSLIGEGQKGGIAYTYYELANRGAVIEIFSNGKRFRNLLHVQDLNQTIGLVIDKKSQLKKYEVFLLGSRDSKTMLEIAQIICRELKSSSVLRPVERNSPVDIDIIIDNKKAKKILGFSPMTVEQALELYLKEIK